MRQAVPNRGGVLGHSSFLYIITCFSADQKPFMAQNGVDVGGGSLEEVEESTEVEVGLLIMEIDFSAVGLLGRQVVGEDFGFQAFGELVFEFDLGIERVTRGP